MTFAIPFFGKSAGRSAPARSATAALQQPVAPSPAPRLDPRRLRVFVRPRPTLFQRCLATHMYFAARRSALD
jgi:hypothetical protein